MAYKYISVQVRIPSSWNTMLKKDARKQTPPATRESVLYGMIETGVNKIIAAKKSSGKCAGLNK